jgi:hypothetical protein
MARAWQLGTVSASRLARRLNVVWRCRPQVPIVLSARETAAQTRPAARQGIDGIVIRCHSGGDGPAIGVGLATLGGFPWLVSVPGFRTPLG